jgi:predicted nucleotidyltransferase
MRNNARFTQLLLQCQPVLKEKYGVEKVGFCSWWTHQKQPTSDLLIIVQLAQPIGWKFYAMKEWLEYKFKCNIDLITTDGLKPIVKEEVLSLTKFI